MAMAAAPQATGTGFRARVQTRPRCASPIAAKGNEHMMVLSSLARILLDPEQAEELRSASQVDDVLRLLAPIGEDEEDDE